MLHLYMSGAPCSASETSKAMQARKGRRTGIAKDMIVVNVEISIG